MRKILYSPDYGAGWTTWNSGDVARYMLDYAPIVEFLEAGGKFERNNGMGDEPEHPLLEQLKRECKEKFGEDYVCTIGARDLRVMSVDGRVKIDEYDGFESVVEEDSFDGWM